MKILFESSASLLSKVTDILSMGLLPYAEIINIRFNHYFQPLEPGIYYKNLLEPMFKVNEFYYVLRENDDKTKSLQSINVYSHFNTLEEDIYDEKGEIVISKEIIKDKVNFTMDGSNSPMRAISIIVLLIQARLFRINLDNKIYDLFIKSNQINYSDLIDKIENEIYSLYDLLDTFIRNDTNHIYEIEGPNSFGEIIIYKLIDARILQWTIDTEKKLYSGIIPEDVILPTTMLYRKAKIKSKTKNNTSLIMPVKSRHRKNFSKILLEQTHNPVIEIEGPSRLFQGETYQFKIVNYTNDGVYLLEVIEGMVTRDGDTITYTAPYGKKYGGFIISGNECKFYIN